VSVAVTTIKKAPLFRVNLAKKYFAAIPHADSSERRNSLVS